MGIVRLLIVLAYGFAWVLSSCTELRNSTNSLVKQGAFAVSKKPECRVLEPRITSWLAQDRMAINFQCGESSGEPPKQVHCRLGGPEGHWVSCSGSGVHRLERLTNGQHVFEVRAEYADGVVAISAPFIWKVDFFEPSILNVDRSFDTGTHELRFDIEAGDSGGSGIERLECELSPLSGWKACEQSVVYRVQDEAQEYVFRVRALDRAGNVSPIFTDDGFQLTRVPSSFGKGVHCELVKDLQRSVRERSFTISFECREDSKPLDRLECRLNQGDWVPCLSARHHRLEKLTLGEHRFEVRKSLNRPLSPEEELVDSPLVWEFLVDDVAPRTTMTHAQTASLTPSFSFTSQDNFSFPLRHECQLESGGRILKPWHTCRSPVTLSTGLQEGQAYRIRARSIDLAGNVGVASEKTWTATEQHLPVCLILHQGRDPSPLDEQLKVDFFCHGPQEVERVECRSNEDPWRTCTSSTFDLLDMNEAKPIHSFQVRAKDRVGNWGEPSLPFFLN